jgi:hypothetical protein
MFQDVRFEVSTAVTMMIIIFWEMTIIMFQDVSEAFFIKMTTTDDKEAAVSKSAYRQN